MFGFANGFVLLPVLMSEIGPLGTFESKPESDENQDSKEDSDRNNEVEMQK